MTKLSWWTVAGFYSDNRQRYTGWFKTDSPEMAEAQAKRVALKKHSDALEVCAIFKGRMKAQEMAEYL